MKRPSTLSSKKAAEKEYYDANPGGTNTILQLSAYGEIAREIFDELRDAPKVDCCTGLQWNHPGRYL